MSAFQNCRFHWSGSFLNAKGKEEVGNIDVINHLAVHGNLLNTYFAFAS